MTIDLLGMARHGLSNFEQIAIVAVLVVAFISLMYAWLLRGTVLKKDKGSQKMQEVWDAIRVGANSYLSRQLKSLGQLAGPLAPPHQRHQTGRQAIRGIDQVRQRRAALRHGWHCVSTGRVSRLGPRLAARRAFGRGAPVAKRNSQRRPDRHPVFSTGANLCLR